VLHNKAIDTRELVILRWENDHIHVEVGQITPAELKTARIIGIFAIDYSRELVGNAFLESFDALGIVIRFAWCSSCSVYKYLLDYTHITHQIRAKNISVLSLSTSLNFFALENFDP
jgi:hypothetical protein